jgi:adenylate cyclase class IV
MTLTSTPDEADQPPGRLLDGKFPCGDLTDLARCIQAANGRYLSSIRQTDTYFSAPRATLKLRQSSTMHPARPQGTLVEATLIAYWRDAHTGQQTCTYYQTPVSDPAACRAGLGAALGIDLEVDKLRQVWLVGENEVHLDDVHGIGMFCEIETPEHAGQAAHDRCRTLLGLAGVPPVACSYAQLARSLRQAGTTS